MKYIIGFFMAWGNFITLPCPYKRWNNDYKNIMLSFLPLVGVVVGALWVVLGLILNAVDFVTIPHSIVTLVMMFYIFAVCGFMHMDGFMDCNDAILSRRPLEDRQRILKDSTVGAFAVVTLAFLLIGWYASFEAINVFDHLAVLFIIPILSRGTAGFCVMSFRPIGHSQYVSDFRQQGKGKYKVSIICETAILTVITGLVAINFSEELFVYALVVVANIIAGMIANTYARKQLGGMSGDIAGYMICISELASIITLAVFAA